MTKSRFSFMSVVVYELEDYAVNWLDGHVLHAYMNSDSAVVREPTLREVVQVMTPMATTMIIIKGRQIY